jgi:hypothetical protein
MQEACAIEVGAAASLASNPVTHGAIAFENALALDCVSRLRLGRSSRLRMEPNARQKRQAKQACRSNHKAPIEETKQSGWSLVARVSGVNEYRHSQKPKWAFAGRGLTRRPLLAAPRGSSGGLRRRFVAAGRAIGAVRRLILTGNRDLHFLAQRVFNLLANVGMFL